MNYEGELRKAVFMLLRMLAKDNPDIIDHEEVSKLLTIMDRRALDRQHISALHDYTALRKQELEAETIASYEAKFKPTVVVPRRKRDEYGKLLPRE